MEMNKLYWESTEADKSALPAINRGLRAFPRRSRVGAD